jgi:hypothetical protein
MDKYLVKIIKFASVNDYLNINQSKAISRYAAHSFNFVSLFAYEDNDSAQKAMLFIKSLDIRFNTLDETMYKHELFDFIVKNQYFDIIPTNINTILSAVVKANEGDITTRNLTTIINSNYKPLITYIKLNLSTYAENVLLVNSNNTEESEEALLLLLNDNNMSDELKISLINQFNTIIISLLSVNKVLWNTLLSEFKMKTSWNNIIQYFIYSNNKIDELLAEFITDSPSLELLTEDKFQVACGDELGKSFFVNLVYCNQIPEEIFERLIKSIPWQFSLEDINSSTISERRMTLLLSNESVCYSIQNYCDVRENHKSLLPLIWKNSGDQFFNDYLLNKTLSPDKAIGGLIMDEEDIALFLSTELVSLENKTHLISSWEESFICKDDSLADSLYRLILDNPNADLTLQIKLLRSLLQHRRSDDHKVVLLNSQLANLTEQDTLNCLDDIGNPYDRIGLPWRRVHLENNEANRKLVNTLEEKLSDYISSINIDGDIISINSKRG